MKSLDEIMERGNRFDYHLPRWSHAREIDDALDAAGAPHCDASGSLSTVQRIQALGERAELADRREPSEEEKSQWRREARERMGTQLPSAAPSIAPDDREAFVPLPNNRAIPIQMPVTMAVDRLPLGAKPKWLNDTMRMADLAEAIARYLRSNSEISMGSDHVEQWVIELAEINSRGDWHRRPGRTEKEPSP